MPTRRTQPVDKLRADLPTDLERRLASYCYTNSTRRLKFELEFELEHDDKCRANKPTTERRLASYCYTNSNTTTNIAPICLRYSNTNLTLTMYEPILHTNRPCICTRTDPAIRLQILYLTRAEIFFSTHLPYMIQHDMKGSPQGEPPGGSPKGGGRGVGLGTRPGGGEPSIDIKKL